MAPFLVSPILHKSESNPFRKGKGRVLYKFWGFASPLSALLPPSTCGSVAFASLPITSLKAFKRLSRRASRQERGKCFGRILANCQLWVAKVLIRDTPHFLLDKAWQSTNADELFPKRQCCVRRGRKTTAIATSRFSLLPPTILHTRFKLGRNICLHAVVACTGSEIVTFLCATGVSMLKLWRVPVGLKGGLTRRKIGAQK